MSALSEQLASLQAQVAKLESEDGIDRDDLFRKMESERDAAVARADKAEADLQQLKASMGWTMQCLQIRDLFRTSFKAEELPASAAGFLPFNYCPEDTKRLEWINRNGRVGAQDTGFFIVLPIANMATAVEQKETIPDIYNIRCLIDVAMQLHRP